MSDRQEIRTTEQNQQPLASQQQPSQQQRERERALVPRVDVYEDETGITLLADLPGVPKEQLELKVEGDTLQLDATVTPQTPDRLQPVYAEVRVARYRRAFTLSRELDTGRIDANLKDGVLTLRIPKHEHAQPRRIQVQVS
ncbi:Hsp20/alpha crystallin family protein [Ideonella sp. BN130291]|uniref:Hsp20/alpha crystallin family protein n=1 Tax=Ideonella sp. BN130291 TaxID=3112940 RepID=UPI002E26720B|nr:Hsp20/alpha crystallin family protein [Ideonella sp. BN130291]